MRASALHGLAILAGALLLSYAAFAVLGLPAGPGAAPGFTAFLAGAYALTSLAAVVFARGLLGLFLDLSRPAAFFRALTGLTDPLMALFRPVTPGFLHPAFRPFHAAFCLYFLKLTIFGGLGAPPLLLYLVMALLIAAQ